MKIERVSIDDYSPADYNPRHIGENEFNKLRESIDKLGVVKPIVINKNNNIILAGHQRTKACKSLGIIEVPAIFVSNVAKTDEVRFNQLHNLAEVDQSKKPPKMKINLPEDIEPGGFYRIENSDIVNINMISEANKVSHLCRMITRYGQFGTCLVDSEGEIISSILYAKAVKLLGLPLWVCQIDKADVNDAKKFFSISYGQFFYDHLIKNTYIQTLAQKFRLRGEGYSKSTLYEKVVIPEIKKGERILDFGAGQKDYVKMLRKRGYDMHGLEFYLRKGMSIDTAQVNRDVEILIKSIQKHGLYDKVICDSVLNSVDSKEAELSVLLTISALCKPGGIVYWSGRSRAFAEGYAKNERQLDSKREYSYFLDDDGFTANFRKGEWFYQKFHTIEQVDKLNKDLIGKVYSVFNGGVPGRKITASSFQVRVVNEKPAQHEDYLKALAFEFSLPLPKGKSYNFKDKILKLFDYDNITL